MQQILLATHNSSKISRIRDNLVIDGIQFVSPNDLGLRIKDPKEDGQNESENAKIKATAYYEIAKIPCLSLDTGFYIHGLADDKQPSKDVQGSAGVVEGDNDEIRYNKMIKFYQNLVSGFGTQAPAYFKDVFCLYDGQQYLEAIAIREVLLTQEIVGKDVHFPIASIFKIPVINKHYHELSKDEMLEFINPTLEAVAEILKGY